MEPQQIHKRPVQLQTRFIMIKTQVTILQLHYYIINNTCIKTNSYLEIFILIKKNYENKRQVITKYQNKDMLPIIIAGNFEYNSYKTVVKSLATIDMEIMELIRRRQEITKMQSQLIQGKKNVEQKLDMKIIAKCNLEKEKLQLLPNAVTPNLQNNPVVILPTQKPKVSPCIIRKITKRHAPVENKNNKVRKEDSDDSMSDNELLNACEEK